MTRRGPGLDAPPSRIAITTRTERTLGSASGSAPAPVVRHSVLHQLDGAEKLVVLHGGRFSGVTELLRSWADRIVGSDAAAVFDPVPGTTEDDYWSRVAANLVGPAHRRPPGTSPFEDLCATTAAHGRHLTLILDDVHLVPDAIEKVTTLLAHAPPGGMRVVASTLHADHWYDVIARCAGRKLLGPAELRVETDDVGRLLEDRGLRSDPRTPELLRRATGGMATLVNLVLDTLPASVFAYPVDLPDLAAAAIDRHISGVIDDDRILADHRVPLLLSAAADPQTPDTVDLLSEVVPEGPTPEARTRGLLDPVPCHRDRPAPDLGSVIVHSGMGLLAGTASHPEWRTPSVIRESLLRLADDEAADELHDYRIALVDHWLDGDEPTLALRAAADARDWMLAVSILRRHIRALYTRHYPVTVRDAILSRIPESYIRTDPLLVLLRRLHNLSVAPKEIASLEPTLDASALAAMDNAEKFFHAISRRVAGRFAESAEICDSLVEEPLADISTASVIDRDAKAFSDVHRGLSYLLVGRFPDAQSAFRRAHFYADSVFVRREAAGRLALVHAFLGEQHEARRWLDAERKDPPLRPSTEKLLRPSTALASALLALDTAEVDTATDILVSLGSPADFDETWALTLYVLCQLGLVNRTPAATLRHVEKDMARFASMRDNGAVAGPLLDAARADLLLANHQPERAAELVGGSTHPVTATSRARLALLTDTPTVALGIVEDALASRTTSVRDVAELEVVGAAAAQATGQRSRATAYLSGATRFAEVTGTSRPFTILPGWVYRRLETLGPPLPKVAQSVTANYGTLTYDSPGIRSLMTHLGAVARDESPARESGPNPTARPGLTDRELAVLRGLATGSSIRAIAAHEFVSINTVKSQLASVYRKLGVNSRTAAVREARMRGILDGDG